MFFIFLFSCAQNLFSFELNCFMVSCNVSDDKNFIVPFFFWFATRTLHALAGLAAPAFFFFFHFSSFLIFLLSFLFFHLSFLGCSKNFAVSGGTDVRPLFFFSLFFSPF